MKLELKNRWIEALRSGNYKQGIGALRTIHDGKVSHCCIGVLCDVVDPQGWGGDITAYRTAIEARSHTLAAQPLSKIGSGSLGGPGLDTVGMSSKAQGDLINMNDTYRDSFEQIAEYIEQYVPVSAEGYVNPAG